MLSIVQHVLARPHAARMRRRQDRRLKPIKPSRAAELWYRNRLQDLSKALCIIAKRVLTQGLGPRLPRGMDSSPWDREFEKLRNDPAFMGLSGQAEELSRLAGKKSLFWVDSRLAKEVSQSLGIDIRAAISNQGKVMERLKEFQQWNLHLISSIPEEFLDKLGEKLSTAWASGMRVENITDIVDEVGDVTASRAKLIARDQTAKMNAAFNQVRQTDLGIESYIWQCSLNERVRGNPAGLYPDAVSNHWALHGKLFRWDEPGPANGTIDGEPCHPGEDVQCQCDAIPVFDIQSMEAEATAAEEAEVLQ